MIKKLLAKYKIAKAQRRLNISAQVLARYWNERKAVPPEALDALSRDVLALEKALGVK